MNILSYFFLNVPFPTFFSPDMTSRAQVPASTEDKDLDSAEWFSTFLRNGCHTYFI